MENCGALAHRLAAKDIGTFRKTRIDDNYSLKKQNLILKRPASKRRSVEPFMTGFSIADLIGSDEKSSHKSFAAARAAPENSTDSFLFAQNDMVDMMTCVGIPAIQTSPVPAPDAFGLWQSQVPVPGVLASYASFHSTPQQVNAVSGPHPRSFHGFIPDRSHWMHHVERRIGHPLPACFHGQAPHQFAYHNFRKPKRIRTAFSPNQLLRLDNAFERNHYVVGQERKQLAASLNLTETQVKVWFQNRRTKYKRLKTEESEIIPDDEEEDVSRSPISSPIHHDPQQIRRESVGEEMQVEALPPLVNVDQ